MASFRSLPVELFEPIMADISRADMSRLSRTCKALHSTLVPVLFRKVTLTWDYESQVGPPLVGLIQMLLRNPSVASHVRELELQTRGYYETLRRYKDPGQHWKDEDFYILPEGFDELPFFKEGALPFEFPALRDEERAPLQQLLEACGTSESKHCANYNMKKAGLNVAIALLLSLCSQKIESLTVDVLVLLHSDYLPAFLKGSSSEVHRLTHVSMVCGTYGCVEYYRALENFPRQAYMLPLHCPALKTLDLAFFPDLHSRLAWYTRKGPHCDHTYAMRTPWPYPLAPVAAKLTTLRLRRTFASLETLQFILQRTPHLTTLEYDGYIVGTGETNWTILRETLHPFRSTLRHLSIRCDYFSEDSTELDRVTHRGSLGSLHDFEALTTLNISISILYGEGKVRKWWNDTRYPYNESDWVNEGTEGRSEESDWSSEESNWGNEENEGRSEEENEEDSHGIYPLPVYPLPLRPLPMYPLPWTPLKDLLPPHLQRLTINDDFWYSGMFAGLGTVRILRKFFTGDNIRWIGRPGWGWGKHTWVEGGPPGWKTATPELRDFVLDASSDNGYSVEQPERAVFRRAVEEQGVNCSILDTPDKNESEDESRAD